MPKTSNPNKQTSAFNFLSTFKHASRGIWVTFKYERNMKIHVAAGVGVVLAAILLNVTVSDFAILLILIAMVMATELINTAIENICNILRDTYKLPYEGSRDIRDIAAGAVWVCALIAVMVGVLILGKYLL